MDRHEPSKGTRAGDTSDIGPRLRAERERQGLSVRALAGEVGISASMVSQIETNKVSPSVGTLYSIVTRLGLSMDQVFASPAVPAPTPEAAPEPAAPRDGRVESPVSNALAALVGVELPVQRSADRRRIALGNGVHWERLTTSSDRAVDFLYVEYAPGSESCSADALVRHGGHEFGYVLRGRLGVTIAFDTYELAPDDSISFSSDSPHRLFAIGDEPVHAIWVVFGRRSDRRLSALLDRN